MGTGITVLESRGGQEGVGDSDLILAPVRCSSDGKESAGNAGDPGLIPGWGRSLGEGNGSQLQYSCLGNPWTEKPGRLQCRVVEVFYYLVCT